MIRKGKTIAERCTTSYNGLPKDLSGKQINTLAIKHQITKYLKTQNKLVKHQSKGKEDKKKEGNKEDAETKFDKSLKEDTLYKYQVKRTPEYNKSTTMSG